MSNNKDKGSGQIISAPLKLFSADNTWRIFITKRTIKIVGALLLTLLLSTSAFCGLYFSRQNDINKVNELRQENSDKEKTITELKTQIEKLEAQQERIDSKQQELKKLIGITSEEDVTPLAAPGGQGGVDTGLNEVAASPLNQGQSIINQWNTYEKELDNYIAKVNDDQQYFRSLPNQWPSQGEISSMYGWRKSPFGGETQTFHNGIDIAGSGGENIVAAGDGKVCFAGWKGAYGRTIEIDHGSGFVTMYGHNSSLLVKVDQEVKKGDVIARLGNTGRSTGPHLHFTIFRWQESYDPLIYLP